MAGFYNCVHLNSVAGGFELINFSNEKFRKVDFKTTIDDAEKETNRFVFIKAVVDGVLTEGYLDLSEDRELLNQISTLTSSEIELLLEKRAQKINDYILFKSDINPSSIEELKGCMHLGIDSEEDKRIITSDKPQDIMLLSDKFNLLFSGETIEIKIENYRQKIVFFENDPEALKILDKIFKAGLLIKIVKSEVLIEVIPHDLKLKFKEFESVNQLKLDFESCILEDSTFEFEKFIDKVIEEDNELAFSIILDNFDIDEYDPITLLEIAAKKGSELLIRVILKNNKLTKFSLNALFDKAKLEGFHSLIKVFLENKLVTDTRTDIKTITGIVSVKEYSTINQILKEDFTKFIVDALSDNSEDCIIRTIGPDISFNDPYLIFIAKQRYLLGSDFTNKKLAEKLEHMPFYYLDCSKVNETLVTDSSFHVIPEDIKIYSFLYSKIYRHIVNQLDFTFKLNQYFDYVNKIVDPIIKTENLKIINFLTFNGIDEGSINRPGLSGNFELIVNNKIADAIIDCSHIFPFDCTEFVEGLRSVFKTSFVTEKTIQKIIDGEFVVVNVGYETVDDGHLVSLMFINDEFVICNRGHNFGDTKVVKRFSYEKDKLNIDVLKYLIINFRVVQYSDLISGVVNQYLQLEVILPKILNAKRIDETTEISPSFKIQKIANCTKASSLTAVKMGIYLKLIKDGRSVKEATLIAKNIGEEISNRLRVKSIEEAKEFLISHPEDHFLREAIIKAENKLFRTFNSIFPKECLIYIETILNSKDVETIRESKKEDHPLLCAIAKQRVILRERFTPTDLKFIPLNYKKCIDYLEKDLGGLILDDHSILKITSKDEAIFKFFKERVDGHYKSNFIDLFY